MSRLCVRRVWPTSFFPNEPQHCGLIPTTVVEAFNQMFLDLSRGQVHEDVFLFSGLIAGLLLAVFLRRVILRRLKGTPAEVPVKPKRAPRQQLRAIPVYKPPGPYVPPTAEELDETVTSLQSQLEQFEIRINGVRDALDQGTLEDVGKTHSEISQLYGIVQNFLMCRVDAIESGHVEDGEVRDAIRQRKKGITSRTSKLLDVTEKLVRDLHLARPVLKNGKAGTSSDKT